MGKKSLIIWCLIWVLAIHKTSANENNNLPLTPQIIAEDPFKIPEVTQDVRYDPILAEWVAESVMRFAHNLAISLDDEDFPNTQIFSPLSVMSALSLLQMGANGKSYIQLSKLFPMIAPELGMNSWKIHEEFGWMLEDLMSNKNNLKRPRNESAWKKTQGNPNAFGKGGENTPDEHTIRIANGLFLQDGYSLRPDYKFAAQSVYKSEVTPLDFRTRKDYAKHYINSWVNQNTLGKIPAIIVDEINSDTKMIIASALYFKGFWEQPFLGTSTLEANFFPDGPTNPSIKVRLMAGGGVFPYYSSAEYNCNIIGLPYKGNQTTMYIIRPHDSTRRNLFALQKLLTGEKINELISKMERKTAVIAFPKFHATNTMHLKAPLIKMGIEDIFQNRLSDLSLIADGGQDIPLAASFPVEYKPVLEHAPAFSPQLTATKSVDRFNETPLIFTRFGEMANVTVRPDELAQMQWSQQGDLMTGKVIPQGRRLKRTVTYKVESEFMRSNLPLRLKDLILSKRITKPNPGKKISRNRRQAIPASAASLQNLDQIRSTPGLIKPQLYVDDILHKVDFIVNEQGTEAAAVTLTYLRRSGTDVAFRCDTPFLVLVRHDPTKLPLFYGKVNIPLP